MSSSAITSSEVLYRISPISNMYHVLTQHMGKLHCPTLPKGSEVTFFFTEEGWLEIGSKLWDHIMRIQWIYREPIAEIMTINRGDGLTEVYTDELQVAVDGRLDSSNSVDEPVSACDEEFDDFLRDSWEWEHEIEELEYWLKAQRIEAWAAYHNNLEDSYGCT